MKGLTFQGSHSIDLRFETWNPHHNNILQNEKTMGAQTIFAISRNQCKWTPDYSKRLKFWPIWLAPLWPRITLIEQAGNMLYESLFNERKALESPRRDTTCASMGKFEKIGPKSRSERCFLMIFWRFSNVVPEASRTISVKIFHVFWCPEALGSFLGWSWIDSGNFIFSCKILKKLTQVKNFELYFNQAIINKVECSNMQSALK